MLTLDSVQRDSCSHQSCCQLATKAFHCMYHLLCTSGFPEVLHFFLYVHVGKHRFLAESTSLKSHRTVSSALFCPWCTVVIIFTSFLSVLCLFWCLQQLCTSHIMLLRDWHTNMTCVQKHTNLPGQYFIILRNSRCLNFSLSEGNSPLADTTTTIQSISSN